MGASATHLRRSPKAVESPKGPLRADRWESSIERRETGVHQLFVRSPTGRSLAVDADLDEDVGRLAHAFGAQHRRQKAALASLRFTFGGQTLELGVPLWKYGIGKGSNVHALVCPCAGLGQGAAKSAWAQEPAAVGAWAGGRGPVGRLARWALPGSRSPAAGAESLEGSGAGLGAAEAAALAREDANGDWRSKLAWVEIPVTITTPFAEVDGTLAYPERSWGGCRLSPRVLRRMVRVSDVMGVHMPREVSLAESGWRLQMRNLHPFPCVQPPTFGDIWTRLQATTARIEIWSPEEALLAEARPLLNEDDEVVLGAVDRRLAPELHISVVLLKDAEMAVDDVTVRFREPTWGGAARSTSKDEVCSVCLEPMSVGQMCRRLPCLHCLHAGCAMTLLPEAPWCPICRSSLVPPAPTAACGVEGGSHAAGGSTDSPASSGTWGEVQPARA